MRYSTFALWQVAASAALQAGYGLSLPDSGADEAELRLYYADHAERGVTVKEFADAFAEDHDLITPDEYTAKDLARMFPIPAPDQCATPEQVARATAPVFFTGDPNYSTAPGAAALEPGEAYAAGNYGTVCFDAATGKVTRHFPGVDFDGDDMDDLRERAPDAWQPGYLDIASFDVAAVEGGVKPGDIFDICYIGFTTDSGDYVAAETPEPED